MDAVATPEPLLELESNLAQAAISLFAPGTVEGTLQKIVELAELAVDGCEAAGIMLSDSGALRTAAASSSLAVEIDQMQLGANEGPCLNAATQGTTVHAHDLIDDPRWPTFAAAATAAGIRTVLAYPLSVDRPSALNLYARLPTAFGATDRAQGLLFATLARLALDSARERAADATKAQNLTQALRTRELIGQAQGILIERDRITADQAFEVLRRASQNMNIKLREVAEALVETGETPTDHPRTDPSRPEERTRVARTRREGQGP
jgi:GAF domain-containing protein